MESQTLRAGQLRRMYVCVVGLIAALALAFVPANASAASPVLEFVIPSSGFPVSFTAEGGEVTAEMTGFETVVHCSASKGQGEITGPRSTLSSYALTGCETQGGVDGGRECKSENANANEIKTGIVEAELVYIDQAKHEVAMLLNPHGGVYLSFECGGEAVEAVGSFLAPVDPINKEATSFTASLIRLGTAQTPDEYEGANGEKLPAIPMGKRGTHSLVATAVELSFTIHPSVSLEIKSISTAEIEAQQHAETKQHEEEAATAAATKKHQEEEAAAAAAKKHQEEEAAAAAAAKKHQEEEAAAKKQQEEKKTEPKHNYTRGQLLNKALKQCKKAKSTHKRAQCEKAAQKKYGGRGKSKKHKR